MYSAFYWSKLLALMECAARSLAYSHDLGRIVAIPSLASLFQLKAIVNCLRGADHVTVNPHSSVLVLTDFTGAAFDRDALRAMKETAVFDKPFVKKSALIGRRTPRLVLRRTKELLPAETADFQDSRGSSGLAGIRFGGRLSRLRDQSGGLAEVMP